MKSLRQAKIKDIIEHHNVETQEDLALALEKAGCQVVRVSV